MNARDIYHTTRARSASPSPRRSHVVNRILAKLKEKGPSPTSVMTKSFGFDDEPYDCSLSTKKRASSVGNLKRINGTIPQQTLRTSLLPSGPPQKSPVNQKPAFFKIPPRSPLKPPSSPGDKSVSTKASNFRQRRLRLARQSTWKDEVKKEKSAHSTISKQDGIVKRLSTNCKENFINGTESKEFSISDYLEIEGFTCSFDPRGKEQNQRGEFPLQAARVNADIHGDEENINNDNSSGGGSVINDEYDDAMTIDTVSSLNTMHTGDAFSTGGWSAPGIKSPVNRSPKRIVKAVRKRHTEIGDIETALLTMNNVHPPMFVQSRIRKLKNGVIASVAESERNIDYAKVIHSSSRSGEALQIQSQDGDENEIPSTTLSAGKYDRSSPSSQMFAESATQCDERSVASLRKNRLQKMRITRNKAKAEFSMVSCTSDAIDEESAETKSEQHQPLPNVPREIKEVVIIKKPPTGPKDVKLSSKLSKPSPFDESKGREGGRRDDAINCEFHKLGDKRLSGEIQEVIIIKKPQPDPNDVNKPLKSPKISPFDENNGQVDDHDDDAIDCELHELGDKREDEGDTSVVTTKSVRTMNTLKTCFSERPTTKKEMERMIKSKQNRLSLIHHALTCTHPYPEDADDETYVPCPEVKHCHALSVLVRHVQTCTHSDVMNGVGCEVPACAAYKKLWNHYRRCVLRTFTKPDKKSCKICGDMFRKYAFDLETSFEKSIEIESRSSAPFGMET